MDALSVESVYIYCIYHPNFIYTFSHRKIVQILFDNLGKLHLSDTKEAIVTMPNSTTVMGTQNTKQIGKRNIKRLIT
ncbi:hypothetical protein VNO80_10210 [Phaseolus coccineus]|uniref:Uncharacterized protein n=1 Tax=Phaseolus coccineus TaxID=3886 RepID=A0AAN9N9F3_PHACN